MSSTVQAIHLKAYLRAVGLVQFSTFYTFGATVAAIVVTAFVVVIVVTVVISLVARRSTGVLDRLRVQALALRQ